MVEPLYEWYATDQEEAGSRPVPPLDTKRWTDCGLAQLNEAPLRKLTLTAVKSEPPLTVRL